MAAPCGIQCLASTARHVLVHVVDDADAGLLQARRGGSAPGRGARRPASAQVFSYTRCGAGHARQAAARLSADVMQRVVLIVTQPVGDDQVTS
jgi:hypothetical protein